MTTLHTYFHLKPTVERFSSSKLKKSEDNYLESQNQILNSNLPMPNPKLQLIVVVPALNEESFITNSLSSLINQHILDGQVEILVVDNGSTDHTRPIVEKISRDSRVPVMLLSQPKKGGLNSIKMGMDTAIQRFSQVSGPENGIIASIDADSSVSPKWASTIIQNFAKRRVDMLRGMTCVFPPLPSEIEKKMKELCDFGNRVNAYSELSRLRVNEKLTATSLKNLPIWLPRITGPNIAISRSAYIAVKGFNPNCLSDQASLLANPLLRMGGIFYICNDPDMALNISHRFSNRQGNIGRFFGTLGFGAMLEYVTRAATEKKEVLCPNPLKLEDGYLQILSDLDSTNYHSRKRAQEVISRIYDLPGDPNILFDYSDLSGKPEYVAISEAKKIIIGMTNRAGGIDYRNQERFLMTQAHLRAELLSSEQLKVDPKVVLPGFLKRSGAPFKILPPHIRDAANMLLEINNSDKEEWYSEACFRLQNCYAEFEIS